MPENHDAEVQAEIDAAEREAAQEALTAQVEELKKTNANLAALLKAADKGKEEVVKPEEKPEEKAGVYDDAKTFEDVMKQMQENITKGIMQNLQGVLGPISGALAERTVQDKFEDFKKYEEGVHKVQAARQEKGLPSLHPEDIYLMLKGQEIIKAKGDEDKDKENKTPLTAAERLVLLKKNASEAGSERPDSAKGKGKTPETDAEEKKAILDGLPEKTLAALEGLPLKEE